MSNTHRRYRAINQGLMPCYHPRPTGHREHHLNTLVAMICGVIGGKHAHLPTIADHALSHGATQESVITRFRRFLQHDARTLDGWFWPVAQALLQVLAHQPIRVVMDGSVVSSGAAAWPCWSVWFTTAGRCRSAGSSSPRRKAIFPKPPIGRCWPRASRSGRRMRPSSSWAMASLTGSTSTPTCAAWGGSRSAAPPPTW